MKQYIISETRLRDLIRAEEEICALNSGGVDNWEWYCDSIQDYLRENNYEDMDDAVEKELESYTLI